MRGGRRSGTRHGTATGLTTITVNVDASIGRLGSVATLVHLLPNVGRSRSVVRRLSIRGGAFSLRRLLFGGGPFYNGCLLLREGIGQILFEDNFEVFNSLKLAKL